MTQFWPTRAFHLFDQSDWLRDGQKRQAGREDPPNPGKVELWDRGSLFPRVSSPGASGSWKESLQENGISPKKVDQRGTKTDNII